MYGTGRPSSARIFIVFLNIITYHTFNAFYKEEATGDDDDKKRKISDTRISLICNDHGNDISEKLQR